MWPIQHVYDSVVQSKHINVTLCTCLCLVFEFARHNVCGSNFVVAFSHTAGRSRANVSAKLEGKYSLRHGTCANSPVNDPFLSSYQYPCNIYAVAATKQHTHQSVEPWHMKIVFLINPLIFYTQFARLLFWKILYLRISQQPYPSLNSNASAYTHDQYSDFFTRQRLLSRTIDQ